MITKLKTILKNLIKKPVEKDDFERINITIPSDSDVIFRRSERAHQLLNDPIMKEAFEAIELAIVNLWAKSPIAAKEDQHELRLMLQAQRDFKRVLEGYFKQGKVEEVTIKAKERKILNFKGKTQ